MFPKADLPCLRPPTTCHPSRSYSLPKGPGSGVEGPAVLAGLNRFRRASILTSIALLALAATSPFWAQAQKSAAASVTAELPPGAMQPKATTACLECHEARIILQQRLSKAAWTKEVDKMVKWGAVVDPNDRDALIDYLSANFSPDKPAYEPPRTSPAKSGSAESSK
jgi:hypothetical protein